MAYYAVYQESYQEKRVEPQSSTGGSQEGAQRRWWEFGREGALRPIPVLFGLLALICFGGAVLSERGAVMLVVLGVLFIVTAVYAWMIL